MNRLDVLPVPSENLITDEYPLNVERKTTTHASTTKLTSTTKMIMVQSRFDIPLHYSIIPIQGTYQHTLALEIAIAIPTDTCTTTTDTSVDDDMTVLTTDMYNSAIVQENTMDV